MPIVVTLNAFNDIFADCLNICSYSRLEIPRMHILSSLVCSIGWIKLVSDNQPLSNCHGGLASVRAQNIDYIFQ